MINNMIETNDRITEYKGYYIEYNLYGENEYSVQFCGDEFFFQTMDEAKKFIEEETV